MKLKVIYAVHVKIGDTVVGEVHRDAPSRPVQPMAEGMTVQTISENQSGRLHSFRFHWTDDMASGLHSDWHTSSDLIMVIR